MLGLCVKPKVRTGILHDSLASGVLTVGISGISGRPLLFVLVCGGVSQQVRVRFACNDCHRHQFAY